MRLMVCSLRNCQVLLSLALKSVLAAAAAADSVFWLLRLVSPSLVFFDLLELWNYGRIDMMPDAY